MTNWTSHWKKTTGLVMVIAALTLGSTALIAEAQPGDWRAQAQARGPMAGQMQPGIGLGAWWDNPRVVERLELSEAQQQLLSELTANHRKEQIAHRAKMESLQVDLQQLWRTDPLDERAILRTTSKIASLEAETKVARTKQRLEVARVLTSEQQETIRTFMQQRPDQIRQERLEKRQQGQQSKNIDKDSIPKGQGRYRHRPPAPDAIDE